MLIFSVLFSCYGTNKDSETKQGHAIAGDSGDVETGGGTAGSMSLTPAVPSEKTNTELAYEVINGDWDNGYTRKQLMREAGHDYDAVQRIVNLILLGGDQHELA